MYDGRAAYTGKGTRAASALLEPSLGICFDCLGRCRTGDRSDRSWERKDRGSQRAPALGEDGDRAYESKMIVLGRDDQLVALTDTHRDTVSTVAPIIVD
jgi:hypothetical protein